MTFRLIFIWLSLLFLIACGGDEDEVVIESNGPDLVDDNDDDPGTAAEDPGKAAVDCYPAFEDMELNVATWNIENFPLSSSTTPGKVREILESLDADIVAVQEIGSISQFNSLVSTIQGWETDIAVTGGSDQNIGYVYKSDVFTSIQSNVTKLFDDDFFAFPREAVLTSATHVSGLEVTFINIHLKCCGNNNSEEFDRRESASEALEDYIEENLDDEAVIVLGDFNDDITGITPFQNFIDNPDFRFADQGIAEGSQSNWSYPSFPSHIDHILISDELFDELGVVLTLRPESCVSSYASTVSDHRPVVASFSVAQQN
jgi:endonuclease/exonuclease/phosphatase family metal-dependent hydrolase